jgi:ATP-binding cassette subfamily B multidrug efflux pump
MKRVEKPDQLLSYCRASSGTLAVVTVSGILYNIGLTAGPYFEGRLAQTLLDIIGGRKGFSDMLTLTGIYLSVILFVQGMRCLKRFYVRRFANDTARAMRGNLYARLVGSDISESAGSVMTKAVADVDACAEGMRKFITEVFDTGVALCAYLVMLFLYDWRLALLSCAFTPIAYFAAGKMKKIVTDAQAARKRSAAALSDATLDRVQNALLYRVTGREENRDDAYRSQLADYQKRATAAGIWETVPQPFYHLISLFGVVMIVYFGGRNVAGSGWAAWDIAAFTAFLSAFGKMALKSAKAAKLFNAVQKAQVSWARVKPLLGGEMPGEAAANAPRAPEAAVSHLTVSYPDAEPVLRDVSFSIKPGEILGVTGPVGCGKSTLGRVFLGEVSYEGCAMLGGAECARLTDAQRSALLTYMGHEPDLLWDSVAENIRLDGEKDVAPVLRQVQLAGELALEDDVGSGGVLLSGGQRQRLALGRTLYRGVGLLILDDPFSALDRTTEDAIFRELQDAAREHAVLLISHRLAHFPEVSRVLYLEGGAAKLGTHDQLMDSCSGYARLYRAQTAGGDLDEA